MIDLAMVELEPRSGTTKPAPAVEIPQLRARGLARASALPCYLRAALQGGYVQMATVGRVIVWMCLDTCVGCLIYALHILLAYIGFSPSPLIRWRSMSQPPIASFCETRQLSAGFTCPIPAR